MDVDSNMFERIIYCMILSFGDGGRDECSLTDRAIGLENVRGFN